MLISRESVRATAARRAGGGARFSPHVQNISFFHFMLDYIFCSQPTNTSRSRDREGLRVKIRLAIRLCVTTSRGVTSSAELGSNWLKISWLSSDHQILHIPGCSWRGPPSPPPGQRRGQVLSRCPALARGTSTLGTPSYTELLLRTRSQWLTINCSVGQTNIRS